MHCSKCGTQNPDDANVCLKCGTELAKIEPTAQIPVYYAGFWARFLANFIDSFILGIGGFIIGFTIDFGIRLGIGLPQKSTAVFITNILIGVLFGFVSNWLYFTMMESSSKQATLGKMLLGIRVTDLAGKRISFSKANARYWGKIVSVVILGIGYIMAGFTKKKQALHDIMAKTLVINKQNKPTSKTVVVVSIIVGILPTFVGILAAIIIPNFMGAQPWVKESAVKGGMSKIAFALKDFARNTGGIYPEALTDHQFLAHLPNGQLPGNPYIDNLCISVAEEKAVSNPLNYALNNSGCKGKTTEGKINYYYSPATKPTSWAMNGCNENGVIKQKDGTNFVLHN